MHTLAAQLKASTRAIHDRVEALLGIDAADFDAAAWGRLLGALYRVVQPIEAQLGAIDGLEEWLPDWRSRKRAHLLATDLAALGIAEPAVEAAPVVSTVPGALGALYVVEGSTLGGQVILARLAPRLGATLARSDRYHRRVDVMLHWRRFVAHLNQFGALRPAEHGLCMQGAQSAFAAFETSFARWARRP